MQDNILSPKRIAAEAFTDAAPAVARLAEIYERNVSFLRTSSVRRIDLPEHHIVAPEIGYVLKHELGVGLVESRRAVLY
jgi:hypothetical protein